MMERLSRMDVVCERFPIHVILKTHSHKSLFGRFLLCRIFSDRAGFVVEDHQEIEVSDCRRRTGTLRHSGDPIGIVASRGCLRWPDVERAAIAVFAVDVVLADKFLVSLPARNGVACASQRSVRGSNPAVS